MHNAHMLILSLNVFYVTIDEDCMIFEYNHSLNARYKCT